MGILAGLVNTQLQFVTSLYLHQNLRESDSLPVMDTIILTLGAYDVSAGWAIALAIGAVFFAFIALLIVLLGNNRAQIEAASEL